MVRRYSGRPMGLVACAVFAVLAMAVPAMAQSTGMIKGVVTDDKNQPVEGAKVTIEMVGGTARRFESKTDKKGEYVQIGLPSGNYNVHAEKDKLGTAPASTAVRANTQQTVNLTLTAGAGAGAADARAKADALKKVFEEGVALSSAGKHPEAITKFQEAATMSATCYDCYNNIGYSYAQTKDWEKAEAAYKKSIEIKGDDAAAWNGLATVYHAERKLDLAAEAASKASQLSSVLGASGGASGNAAALYNQAVILFNQGKTTDAKPLLEQAVAADPSNADAHYLLGMTLVGIDPTKAVPEFEAFLKLSPNGPADKVKTANDVIAAFKK
ncbi:MAG: tetratricopeptide repeat protein [Acidobacteriaceae bacterium]|nr:tetratricopeptide repeat protein [Acidobacteriaceae bacterium]